MTYVRFGAKGRPKRVRHAVLRVPTARLSKLRYRSVDAFLNVERERRLRR